MLGTVCYSSIFPWIWCSPWGFFLRVAISTLLILIPSCALAFQHGVFCLSVCLFVCFSERTPRSYILWVFHARECQWLPLYLNDNLAGYNILMLCVLSFRIFFFSYFSTVFGIEVVMETFEVVTCLISLNAWTSLLKFSNLKKLIVSQFGLSVTAFPPGIWYTLLMWKFSSFISGKISRILSLRHSYLTCVVEFFFFRDKNHSSFGSFLL